MSRSRNGARTSGAVTTREAELADSYHSLLRSRPQVTERTYEALLEAHQAHRLDMQDRLLCNVLRPRFMSLRRVEELRRVSEALAGLFERAGDFLLRSDSMLDLVGATEQERSIWSIDPGYPGYTLTSRLDAFMVGEEPRFVEYNAESPAGIAFTDLLSEIFESLAAMQQWESRASLRRFHGRRRLLEALLWAYRSWGGSDTPSIAIIDWEDVLTKRDWELCGSYFREQGIQTEFADPRSFEYRGGKLWLGNVPITLVYRRVLLHELLDRAAQAGALLEAYREGAVCMVNSPRSKLLHKKALFALLSDHRVELEMSPEEKAIVDATVPWTRLMVSGRTTFEGRSVDLVPFVLTEQHRLALKPFDDYGGRGVVLGWETEREEWERGVERALQQHYIVQERVPVPQAEFPVWQEDGVALVPLLLDTDPLLFRGRLGSVLTRISGSALLNVSAGTGSTTPTFMVQED